MEINLVMVELLCRGLTRIYIIIVHNINDRIKPFWSCKWREAVGGVGLGGGLIHARIQAIWHLKLIQMK